MENAEGERQKEAGAQTGEQTTGRTDQYVLSDGMSRSTRASAEVVPAALLMKVQTNIGRISILKMLNEKLQGAGEDVALTQVLQWKKECEEHYAEFKAEHKIVESACPAALVTHEYFARAASVAAFQVYQQCMDQINKHIQKHSKAHPELLNPDGVSVPRPMPVELPPNRLPVFDGKYLDWMGFKELFTSLVINEPRLSEVQKLQYLRSSLTGQPAAWIQGYHLSAESFKLSWDTLVERFEDKRYVLAHHLDALKRIAPAQPNQAASLGSVFSEFLQLYKLIVGMGEAHQILDALFIDRVLDLMDRSTREAWRSSPAGQQEFPAFAELQKFIMGRLDTLELNQAASASSQHQNSNTSKSQKPPKVRNAHVSQTHQAQPQPAKTQPTPTSSQQSSSQPSATPYLCMYCQGAHFVVVCPKFRELAVNQRYQFVLDKPLCFNCLGRHAAAKCMNKKRCVHCGQAHHSMIHGADGLKQITRLASQSSDSQQC